MQVIQTLRFVIADKQYDFWFYWGENHSLVERLSRQHRIAVCHLRAIEGATFGECWLAGTGTESQSLLPTTTTLERHWDEIGNNRIISMLYPIIWWICRYCLLNFEITMRKKNRIILQRFSSSIPRVLTFLALILSSLEHLPLAQARAFSAKLFLRSSDCFNELESSSEKSSSGSPLKLPHKPQVWFLQRGSNSTSM